MCKHVAAVLYGIGARLDQDPSLFFLLRKVNMDEMITKAIEDTTAQWIQKAEAGMDHPTIAEAQLGNLFGIDMDAMHGFDPPATEPPPSPLPAPECRISKRKSRKPLAAKSMDEKMRILKMVNAAIRSAANGIRVATLAKTIALPPAAIRPVMNRLLAEGAIRKISHGVYGPPVTAANQKTATMTDAILALINGHAKGMDIAGLKRKSGYDEKQLRNVVFRLVKAGKIRRVGRGLYAAVAGK